MIRAISTISFFLVLLVSWEVASRSGLYSPVLLPSPLNVLEYLWQAGADGTLWSATLVTMGRLLLGYGIGLLFGVPLGLLTARSRILQDTLGLLALGIQTLPSVCWVPLALLWFGQSEAAMLFVVVMGTLWSVLIATSDGVRAMPPIYLRAARTMGSTGLHTWIKVILPASLPYLVGGMKQGWAFAWRSLMAAEIFVTILTGFGLGQLLQYGRELLAMDQVVAIMVIIVVIGLLADRILFSPWERFFHRRWGTGSVN
ncbi:MAG: ABC transporter permease [Verrucomicrobiota bacterium]|jgi:NitT/TauT family transport system permease protein